ncbi:hypothetical protein Acr_08g0015590 [Actinidia rufa]|uniref:Uncharacterized protein n=1 Tax=Actinidia rufa TaxID=165716 RepID=A0A7J0F3H4_9ERIC|nr:hypothetical protein Acr_08g0015590 [Actinidia rufa]
MKKELFFVNGDWNPGASNRRPIEAAGADRTSRKLSRTSSLSVRASYSHQIEARQSLSEVEPTKSGLDRAVGLTTSSLNRASQRSDSPNRGLTEPIGGRRTLSGSKRGATELIGACPSSDDDLQGRRTRAVSDSIR